MIIYLQGLTYPYVVVMDTEHDQGKLIQYAGVLLENKGSYLYEVKRSVSFYLDREEVTNFTQYYTHITPKFLHEHGICKDDAINKFYNEFLEDIPLQETAFCSHGVKQDANVMRNAGIGIDCCPHICTYNMAKSVLKRSKRLKLTDVLADACMASVVEHNAYTDALGTLWALSYLLTHGGSDQYDKIS